MVPSSLSQLEGWDCQSPGRMLPPANSIRNIHVFDFDNTLFTTPLPNGSLWTPQAIGKLGEEDAFIGGGWWHNSRILAATGDGFEKEQTRAWDGYWNDNIVQLIRLCEQRDDCITVLLTGRGKDNYTKLIQHMLAAKKLYFDLLVLKPPRSSSGNPFVNTQTFKTEFLRTLFQYFQEALDIRIYEDRPRHARIFRNFLSNFEYDIGKTSGRARLEEVFSQVVEVSSPPRFLDAATELSLIKSIISEHNALANDRAPLYKIIADKVQTAYILSQGETSRILSQFSWFFRRNDIWVRACANSILIAARSANNELLSRCGSLGTRVEWEVTHLGEIKENLWAAQVRAVTTGITTYTECIAALILAHTGIEGRLIDARRIDEWQEIGDRDRIRFWTTVGEQAKFSIKTVAYDDERFLGRTTQRSMAGIVNRHAQRKRAHPDESQNDGGNHNKRRFPGNR